MGQAGVNKVQLLGGELCVWVRLSGGLLLRRGTSHLLLFLCHRKCENVCVSMHTHVCVRMLCECVCLCVSAQHAQSNRQMTRTSQHVRLEKLYVFHMSSLNDHLEC